MTLERRTSQLTEYAGWLTNVHCESLFTTSSFDRSTPLVFRTKRLFSFVSISPCRPAVAIIQRKYSFTSLKDTPDSSAPSSGPLPTTIPQEVEKSPRSAEARFPEFPKRRRRATAASRERSAFAQLFPWSMTSNGHRLQSSSQRSESMAYPPSGAASFISKMQYHCRRHSQPLMTATALVLHL